MKDLLIQQAVYAKLRGNAVDRKIARNSVRREYLWSSIDWATYNFLTAYLGN